MSTDKMKKFWEDPYVYSFDAEVKEIVDQKDRIGIVFSTTYFYPEGGGQPSDRGIIGTYPILDVQEDENAIFHYVQNTPEVKKELSKGSHFHCEIDKKYRIHNMRLHTSCHLLFGAARILFSKVNYAGFTIGEIGNLYLETSRQIRAEDLRKMSLLANKIVIEDHRVKDYFLDKAGINNIKDFAYNIELPDGDVRVIEIEGWDIAACSGTHVKRTIELGPIKILAREIHKKNVTRIDYAVGERAVKEINQDEAILGHTSEFLNTSKENLLQIVQKNQTELQSSHKDIKKLSEKLIGYKIPELMAGGKIINEIRLIIESLEFLDANACKVVVTRLLADEKPTVAALICGKNDVSIVAGCSSTLELELSSTIVNIARSFGGGGGGRPNFVTAGGIQTDAKTIKQAIERELTNLLNKKE